MNVHFSNKTNQWETPQTIFDILNAEFTFTLDACATFKNAKCKSFYSPAQDGLKQPWKGRCWMNPPYGRVINRWMKKAYESALNGVLVVCLVPARTDTKWWHDYACYGELSIIATVLPPPCWRMVSLYACCRKSWAMQM